MAEIIPPMLQLQLSFEEFVALKAFVSWQGGTKLGEEEFKTLNEVNSIVLAISNISLSGRDVMRRQLDSIANSLHAHYTKANQL
uniref:NR LBD domain-containing protein n=1 Tax=Heterorhabditis bacteriophora TaxID=37862 RepID=A0A1I7XJB6_HETBA